VDRNDHITAVRVDLKALESVSEEWDALADRLCGEPFLRPGWIGAWWDAFGRGHMEVVTTRDGERLTGVASIIRAGRGLRYPANWHSPEFGFLTEGEDAATELARALHARRPRHVSLSFLRGMGPEARPCTAPQQRRGIES
jgi:CelD/BcsL family acetyltransferase involved in cellulose biosynthesis